MRVIKRDGRQEQVSFDKILRRLQLLASGKHNNGEKFGNQLEIDVTPISQQVIMQIRDGITTKELDEFAASTCASMVMDHPDYSELAGRIIISNHHKNTHSLVDTVKFLYQNKDKKGGPAPMLSHLTYKTIIDNQKFFEELVDYNRDYLLDFFGFKTLERSYLLKTQSGHFMVQERPQHMYIRVSVGIHGNDLAKVKQTYNLLSLQLLSHASPTLFNSGTPHPQNSSCFLLSLEDSLEGIYEGLKKCALISKHAGGLGIGVSDIRSKGSKIRGTNGQSDGLIPMLRVFNETARYVNQGGKRKGSIAVYLEPHHADIEAFLDLKKTHGDQSQRTLDLFLALWISDLFMKRLDIALKNNNDKTVMWSLFCPDEAPGLTDTYGEEYEKLYLQYENERLYREQIPIVDLWEKILTSQKETGVPYIAYKDCVNYRNAQENIGVVKHSNLCIEILLVNDPKDKTISVCNLAAIPLGSYVDDKTRTFDYEGLGKSVSVAIENLNKIIDINFYPVEDCAKSNYRDRPVGLGVIGLQDVLWKMRYPFESKEAGEINKLIFECMYYNALKTSMELAKKEGPYETFKGSPMSKGILQFDMWNEDRARYGHAPTPQSGNWDWSTLKKDIIKYGLRNSTLIALMPTASSAQIVGQNESFEAMTYNVYMRRVLSGDFKLMNKYLQRDMVNMDLWTETMKQKLIEHRGSIQNIEGIPKELKELYKTAFEIKQKTMLNLAIDRSPYIDQTQSLNIFVSNPEDSVLSSIQMYAFKNRLKTGQYYLRREATAKAAQFTVKPPTTTSKVEIQSYVGPTGATGPSYVEKSTEEEQEEGQEGEQEGEPEVKLCRLNDPDCLACQV